MSNVIKLRQPFPKRCLAWFRRENLMGWIATILIIIAIINDLSGRTDKATFVACLAIFALLMAQGERK